MTAAAGATEGGRLPRLGPANDDDDSILWNSLHPILSNRTPFYDKHIMRGVEQGCRQLVLLGAGLDARAFRLDLPTDMAVYEVDVPAVLRFKADALARNDIESPVKRFVVEADLRDDWAGALVSAGFDLSRPTVWIAEGLLMYLTTADVDALIATITAHTAPGSVLASELVNRPPRMDDVPTTDPEEIAAARLFIDSTRCGLRDLPESWLTDHGWQPLPYRDLTDELVRFGRPIPTVLADKPDPFHSFLIAADYQ